MATRRERQFNFRLTAEGFQQFAREMTQTGEAGERALKKLIDASPELVRSLDAAAAAMEKKGRQLAETGRAAEQTARQVHASAAATSQAGGFGGLGQSATRVETRLKSLNRTMNDVYGAMGFVGAAGGALATQIAPIQLAIRGLADVSGSAAAALGAGGLGLFGILTRLIPIAGIAYTAYSLLSGAIGGLARESAAATDATTTLADATRRLEQAAENAEDRQRRLNEEKRVSIAADRAAALAKLEATAQTERETIALAQNRAARVRGVAERLREAVASGRAAPGPVAAVLQRAEATVAGIDAVVFAANERLGETLGEIARVSRLAEQGIAAVGQESSRTARGIAAVGQESSRTARGGVSELDRTLARLREQADRAAETLVDRLLRSTETEWERYAREVDEAEAALTRMAEANRITAEQVTRVRRALQDASPAARAAREAAAEQQREAQRAADEYARVWQRATDTAVKASGDLFFDLFTGRARSIGETFRNMLLRAVSDAAANFIIRPIIAPIIGAVGSAVGGLIGTPGAGGGGFGGMTNLLGLGSSAYQAATGQSLLGGLGLGGFMSTPVFGHSAAAAGMFAEASAASMGLSASQASMLAGSGPTFGSLLGAGGIGFGAGALLGAFGANRTVSSIGGAGLGALGGFLAGGPIGAAIGGIGGILGGLFGGSRRPGFAGGTSLIGVDPATGLLTVIGATGKRFDPAEVERAAAQQIAPLNALLQRAGVTLAAGGLGADPLGRGTPFLGYGIGLGDGARYGSDIDALIRRLAQGGRFRAEDDILRRVLASPGITGMAGLERGIAFADMFRELRAGADTATETERALTALRQRLDEARRSAVEFGFAVADIDRATRAAFERDVQRALRAIEDPVGLALDDFERAARLRLDVARELGADLVAVERLNALERQRVAEQSQQQRAAFERDVQRALLAIEDPDRLALHDVERAAQQRLDVARRLGADLVAVERLNALERQRVAEQSQQRITAGLRSLVDDIAFGGLATAAPEQRFFAALTRFTQAERAALAAPRDVAEVSEFEAAARAVLPIARDFLGTSQRFGEIESRVLATAVRLDPAADPAAIAADRIVQAQATMTAALVAPIGAVRDEVAALRERMERLAQDIAALARRAAA